MLTLLVAAAAAALPARPMRDFGDWTAGCDNGRRCQAIALQPEDAAEGPPPFWTLSIVRDAANLAPVQVAVEYIWEEVDHAVRLEVDGEPTRFKFDGDGALVAGDPLALVRALAKARSLNLVGASGTIVGRLSPTGAAAALRWIDDRQLRAGTTSAILATGPRAAPQVAPELPHIQAATRSPKAPRVPTAAEIAAARKPHECSPPADAEPELHRLDAGTTLAVLPCMLHAYQSSSIVMIAGDSGPWRPAPLQRRFAQPEPDPAPHWMTEPDYDPATRSLWSHYKGRGLGDCGGSEGYIWDGDTFRLAYMNGMDRCQGSHARITLWRTANEPE